MNMKARNFLKLPVIVALLILLICGCVDGQSVTPEPSTSPPPPSSSISLTAEPTPTEDSTNPVGYIYRAFDENSDKSHAYKQYGIEDTLEAEYIAFKIFCTYFIQSGNLFGTFDDIKNVPVNTLVQQALSVTPWVDELTLPADDPIHAAIEQAYTEGNGLGHVCYADDIEATLMHLYGEYPITGESYSDHFDPDFYTAYTYTTYWPEATAYFAHWDSDYGESIPQLMSSDITNESVVCDAVVVTYYDYPDRPAYHYVHKDTELTEENFYEETENEQVLRYTFHYAQDDGRLILYSIQEVKTGQALMPSNDLE